MENVGALVVSTLLATSQDTAKRDTEERTLKTRQTAEEVIMFADETEE